MFFAKCTHTGPHEFTDARLIFKSYIGQGWQVNGLYEIQRQTMEPEMNNWSLGFLLDNGEATETNLFWKNSFLFYSIKLAIKGK